MNFQPRLLMNSEQKLILFRQPAIAANPLLAAFSFCQFLKVVASPNKAVLQ
jgi:hypothetical protein